MRAIAERDLVYVEANAPGAQPPSEIATSAGRNKVNQSQPDQGCDAEVRGGDARS